MSWARKLERLLRGLRTRLFPAALENLLDADSWQRRLRAASSLAYGVPFSMPSARWRILGPALSEELERVFSLRSEAEMEEYLESFAAEYAALAGSPHGVGTSSGTSALTFALLALGLKPGDEVILPGYTFAASALAVCNAGCVPVFADVSPNAQLDARELARRRSPRTKAVMTVHLYGFMADPEPVVEYCRREGLNLVEDACQAHGLLWKGRPAGSFGDAAAFSFNYTKLLCGPGNGGMLVASRSETARRARLLRDPQSRDALLLRGGRTPAYLDPVSAACVRAGLRGFEETLSHHARLARTYERTLSGLPLKVLAGEPGAPHTWYRLVVRTPERERLRVFLKDRGIEARACCETNLSRLSPFSGMRGAAGDFPEAEALSRESLALPIGVHMEVSDAERAAKSVADFFGSPAR